MTVTNCQRMIDRGRKAGLGTTDLYRALASRRSEASDRPAGEADSNGFVLGYGPQGHPAYSPFKERCIS